MKNVDEKMILTVEVDRDTFEKFELALEFDDLCGGKNYTPETYLSKVIDRTCELV